MFFKLTNRNPYRDLVRNARRITISELSPEAKASEYKNLMSLMAPKLTESTAQLTSQTAFAKRCAHWNQRDNEVVQPVTTLKNPWLNFKREFEKAINAKAVEVDTLVSKELAWFYSNPHIDDWIVD